MRKQPPSKAEIEHMGRVKSLPCIVCTLRGERQATGTDAHHIKRDPLTGKSLGGSQKGDGFTTIPLCKNHHWNGCEQKPPFRPIGSKEFERRYGSELDLLVRTYKRLGIPYPFPEIRK